MLLLDTKALLISILVLKIYENVQLKTILVLFCQGNIFIDTKAIIGWIALGEGG